VGYRKTINKDASRMVEGKIKPDTKQSSSLPIKHHTSPFSIPSITSLHFQQFTMPSIAKFISGLALAAAIVSAIPHDEVEAFAEDAPSLFLKHKPYLKVNHGCVPFPAVNSAGEVRYGYPNP
jgi:hypothetical protein